MIDAIASYQRPAAGCFANGPVTRTILVAAFLGFGFVVAAQQAKRTTEESESIHRLEEVKSAIETEFHGDKPNWFKAGHPWKEISTEQQLAGLRALERPRARDENKGNPPNVVLIMADDLGYGDLACYGSEINKTPHIDKLASTGLRFTDYHTAGAMCTPTRAALLTGQYQQRLGRRFENPLSGLHDRDKGLPPDSLTLAEVLRDAGYATACFGKWHLGYEPPHLPPDHGFDLFRGLGSGDGDHHTQVNRWGRYDWWNNNEIEKVEGYTTDLLTEYSVEFIERQSQQKPFFLYLPHLAIHFPWQGPDDPPQREVGGNYENDKWGIIPDPGNVAPHVKAMVEAIDRSLGEIVETLERTGVHENTLVIFTSDNGGYLDYGARFRNISSNGPLRGQKATLYEGGHRVPMIVSWPGKIQPGVTAELTHTVDLFPTIARLAGVDVEPLATDGLDLRPLLLEGEPLPNRALFWRAGRDKAFRIKRWKMVDNGTGPEFYNLDKDLSEQQDIAAERSDLLNAYMRRYRAWEQDVDRSANKLN